MTTTLDRPKRRRKSAAEIDGERREALGRARSGQSLLNWPTIFREFTARGIPERTLDAPWLALRQVLKRHGH